MKNNTTIILLLLAVGIFYLFARPQYQDVKDLNAVASQYRSVLANVSSILSTRDNLLATYQTFPRIDIDRVNKLLPDNVDTVRLALDLDSLASRYGITIKNIQTTMETTDDASLPVLPENVPIYDRAIVSFGFIANYESFIRFMSDLEKNLRIMNIKSITFQATESGLYEYQISVETYWLK